MIAAKRPRHRLPPARGVADRRGVDVDERTCALEGCGVSLEGRRPNTRYCSARCNRRACYVANAEQARAYAREYQAEHRDQVAARMQTWRAANKDRIARYNREYGQEHQAERRARDAVRIAAD